MTKINYNINFRRNLFTLTLWLAMINNIEQCNQTNYNYLSYLKNPSVIKKSLNITLSDSMNMNGNCEQN